MTLEEFRKKAEDEDWVPGWDAIEGEFEKLYPGQNPMHYGTTIQKRAMFGGDQYLDGYSVYSSEKGYKHIVTFGMTELYADEEMFGGEWNKWGYEMTMKLAEENVEDCLWAMDMMANLARYTYTTERFFEHGQFVQGNGESLRIGMESMITALLCVDDTELETIDTVYGKTGFIQLVGITQSELEAIKEDRSKVDTLIELMKADSPDLVTDMRRTKSYL